MFDTRFDPSGDPTGISGAGDSGGPLIIKNDGDFPRVVGNMSGIANVCAGGISTDFVMNLWTRTFDWPNLFALFTNSDGSLLGDEYPDPSCNYPSTTPLAANPACACDVGRDKDCDGVPNDPMVRGSEPSRLSERAFCLSHATAA
jgi:hypothetical protein